MTDERRRWRRIGRDELTDQLDAAARRVSLISEKAERRAVVQTQTARDAGREVLGAHVARGDGGGDLDGDVF